MRAAEQWDLIERELPADWEELRLSFVADDAGTLTAAAAALAPLGPGRSRDELRFQITNSGVRGPEALTNLLRRLDRKRIWGTLRLVDVRAPAEIEPEGPTPAAHRGLTDAWDAVVAALPPDWSDLLCELEVDSSDYLARAALLGAPLNPTRNPAALALRFRASGQLGYGAPAGMARRCFERMDAEGITGTLTVLNALSDADNVGTQGVVWRLSGRSV